jgi:hypothetical protein
VIIVNVHQSIVEFLRMVGLKPEPYYMSESDGPLRDRLKSLYKPEILSKNCEKSEATWLAISLLLMLPGFATFDSVYRLEPP